MSYVYDPSLGEVVPRHEYAARQAAPKRSHLPSPRIVTDAMVPVQSMLDGQLYDSKSALRATYKAAGVVEIGNDSSRLKPRQKPKIDRQSVKTSIERATARFNRGERAA